MLIGDPILPRDRTEVSLASSAPPTPREDVPSGYFKAFDCLKPLPRARDEVVHAAACFDSPTILLDAAASAKNVRRAVASGELSRCHLVHFATHAFESMGHDLGALVFSPDSTAGTGWPDDALIRAWEIAGWQLNAELVTMSACKTAGGTAGADTPLGLSTIFLMAGARSVLTSMWRVDDTATALLMQRFYDSLTGGRGRPMSRAAALREAKQWFRDQEDADGNRPFAHPAYWAGFVLIGDGLD
jgi:CHAT domain-containing protein